MDIYLGLLSVVGGLVLLIAGADVMVRGSASIAKKLRISEIAIGLTIVAFGTSSPELIINTFAAAAGQPDIVFGNVLGSNLSNTLLILGVAGLIYPLSVQRNTVWKEIPLSFLALVVVAALTHDLWGGTPGPDILSRTDGLVLLCLFVVFVVYTFGLAKEDSPEEFHVKLYPTWLAIGMVLLGIGALALGGHLTVEGATGVARKLGVSEKLIACTILALGTSLPELATSAVAAYRKRCDIAVGNVVGSNIFNLLLILGASSLVRPVAYPEAFDADMLLLAVATAFLMLTMFTGKKRKLDRWEAVLLLVGYVGYIVYLIYRG